MARISDLVKDAKLQTRFHSEHVTHVFIETGQTVRQRVIVREEHWQRHRKPVGSGSYGNVWLEQRQNNNQDVELRAVKEVDKSPNLANQIDYHRELEAIMKFSHPNYERCFVKSFGWYENDEAVFIAMEYFQHRDLQRHLSSLPPLPESEALQITFQVLEGLFFMHDNSYAHRDLKPGNILVKSMPPDPWWVKLSDFGISKRASDRLAVTSTVRGSLRYMAPELLFKHLRTSQKGDIRKAQDADMWAVGEIVFQMLTKEQSFPDMGVLLTHAQSSNQFPSDVLRARDVSELGISFINGIMLPNPEDRRTASQALHHAWMEPHNSYITGTSPFVSTEPTALRASLAAQMEAQVQNPSGRWSTVSFAAAPSLSSISSSSMPSVELSTSNTTLSLPESSRSMQDSTNQGGQSIFSSTEARYFILKSDNETDIETSSAHGIWCCGKSNNTRLSNAFKSTSGPVFLIFSVNQSRKFCGVAQMTSVWSPDVTTAHWVDRHFRGKDSHYEGGYHVNWVSWTAVEFDDVSHLTHKEENGISVTRARFVLELCASTGLKMMEAFGVAELVPSPTTRQQQQQPDNGTGTIGSLAVGGLDLAATTTTTATTTTDVDMNSSSDLFLP